EGRRRPPDLRSIVPHVRVAASDPHGQRRALRNGGDSRLVGPQCVVAAARHSAPTDLPAHPQQNGAHERMHKTLKAEAIRPPRSRLATQQRAFNRFRDEYNHERPHQALRGRTPASLYVPSARTYTGELPPFEYPGHFVEKRVTNA